MINRFLFLAFIALFSACQLHAQPKQEYSSSNKKAVKVYEAAQKCYETPDVKTGGFDLKGAELNLQKAIKLDPNFIEAYILLAQVCMEGGRVEESITHMRKVAEINPNFYPNNFLNLANAEYRLGYYEEALAHINKYLSFPRVPEELKKKADKVKTNCEFAINMKKNPVPFNPVNLGPGVNTDRPEYFPTITGDDRMLLFTRLVADPNSPNRNPENPSEPAQEDFFFSIKRGNVWTDSRSISSKINTVMNEGAPSLSSDGQTLIFTACELANDGYYGENRDGFGSCDLFVSFKNGKEWSMPRNMGQTINSQNWETQPSYSADGKTVYFIRGMRSKDGRRTGDIFYAQMSKSGEWERPQRLSDVINTEGNEQSVLIHPDGQTLYFSSDGHPGMGGLDIYMSRRQPNGAWGTPVNLGYPINTHHEENSLLVSSDGKVAFFASDRPGGYGSLDLYSFELPEHLRPIYTTYAKGIVYDAKTKDPLEARFQLVDLSTGEIVVESYSNRGTGEFLVSLATNRNYAVRVEKKGYAFYSKNFSLAERKGETTPYQIDIPLSRITDPGTIVRLENIFFDLDKSSLRPESKIELDKFAEFLTQYPELKIEIGGHTDNRGDKVYNQKLSEARAKAVVDYLVGKGIDGKRLSWKGYGDTMPTVKDAQTEEQHQLNRRIEYTIK